MTDRAGLLAGAAEVFTAQCVYYIVAATMIIGRQGWGLALLWPLLCAAAAADAIGAQLWGGSVEVLAGTLHPLVLLFALSGSLMISRIRIPKL